MYKWYSENGIQNIGEEDYNANYDEKGCYIGKGPVGLYELVCIAKNVAKRLQKEGFLVEHFGKALPIVNLCKKRIIVNRRMFMRLSTTYICVKDVKNRYNFISSFYKKNLYIKMITDGLFLTVAI